MAALLALLSSLLWGTGDFLGGTVSRRVHPVAVMQATQGLAALGLTLIVVASGETGRTGAIGWGVAAGIVGCIGLGAFYSALATGTMGVVAPIAATGVVIPVGYGLLRGDEPTLAQAAGIIVTIIGVVLAAGPERQRRAGVTADPEPARRPTGSPAEVRPSTIQPADTDDVVLVDASATVPERPVHGEDRSRRPFLLAGVAAAAFGGALTLVAQGSETSIAMTLLVMRVTNAGICTILLLTLLRGAPRPRRRDLRALATIGTADAGANGTYAIASTLGQLSVSAVLASLYPAVTALLAWRVHGEHLRRVQVAGVVTTLAGVALIAAG